jgi:hypothetical protein
MSQDNDQAEASLSSRLMSRAGPGIRRRSMPDGGEVVSGPLATEALRALNARAFTMDHTIFVDEDFDSSNPEDAALYAHERHHQMESGGVDAGHGSHDAEEVAARAIESMVLHRSSRGDSLSDIMSDVRSGQILPSTKGGQGRSDESGDQAEVSAVQSAYSALRASGKNHEGIVQDLTAFVVESLMTMEEEQTFRATDASIF